MASLTHERMKLHTKLYLFFAGIVLLPLLAVTVAASILLDRSGTQTYEGRLQSGIVAASAMVTAQARVLTGDLQASLQRTDTASLLTGDTAGRNAAMSNIQTETGAEGVVLRDPAGTVVAQAGNTSGNSGPLISSSIRLSQPDGALWSITLLSRLDTADMLRIFSAEGLDWGLLQDGVVRAGSLTAGTEVRNASGSALLPVDLPDPGTSLQASVGDTQALASAVSIPGDITNGDTILFAGVAADVVGAASREALFAGLVLMLGTALLTGVLGLLLARNITRPLRELTSAATAGIEGDLERRVEVKSKDEIGSLAHSFGLMQASIHDYIAELEESRTQLLLALSYAGEILGSTSDRNRMMKTTAEAARLATGAAGIWVELFPSGRVPGQDAVSAGVPVYFFDNAIKRQAEKLAEEVASGAITAGEPRDFGPENEAVAYPLVHERKALGAMIAVFHRGHSIEESRKILGSLAAQAARAVENVNFGELQQLLAATDPMTNLFNFRYLYNCLDKEISKSHRYDHPLSVAIIDLDDFKAVNDTYGHQAGDELLRAVGEVLANGVREADMVARYGGEEFSVVLPETIKADAMKVIEKLRLRIDAIRLPAYPGLHVTASIGVAGFPEDGEEKTDLLVRADEVLYLAKQAGKNRSISA